MTTFDLPLPIRRIRLDGDTRSRILDAIFDAHLNEAAYDEAPLWNDTWYDNMNTSSHIGFSVFS